jgi:diacylglycerol kinase
MLRFLQSYLRRTLSLNPQAHSAQVSENRWRSFVYALAGFVHMLRYAKNLRIQLLAALVVGLGGLALGLSRVELVLLLLTVTLNMLAEFLNAAVEAVVNLSSPAHHPMAQVAKDVAAGAVLLTTLMALGVAALLFGPPLWGLIT